MNRTLTLAAAGAGAYWAYRTLSGPGIGYFRGKNVLITGGGSGMGRLVARRIAALGGNVVLWDINPENLERVRAEVKRADGRAALAHVCDVSDRAQVYETAKQVKASVGPLDILVSSANVAPEDAWIKQILSVVAYGPMHRDSLLAAYEMVDPAVKADTLLVITVTDGNDAFIYE